jgi:hypothetical protein
MLSCFNDKKIVLAANRVRIGWTTFGIFVQVAKFFVKNTYRRFWHCEWLRRLFCYFLLTKRFYRRFFFAILQIYGKILALTIKVSDLKIVILLWYLFHWFCIEFLFSFPSRLAIHRFKWLAARQITIIIKECLLVFFCTEIIFYWLRSSFNLHTTVTLLTEVFFPISTLSFHLIIINSSVTSNLKTLKN